MLLILVIYRIIVSALKTVRFCVAMFPISCYWIWPPMLPPPPTLDLRYALGHKLYYLSF